jgi:PD-(D/E)XK nuclease superfamily
MTTKKLTRDYISPSDLTFLYGECKRCFWLKYNKGISTPGVMPLVGPMSAMQEARYHNADARSLDSQLRPGKIARFGQSIESEPIFINGEYSKWRIKGKYDLVIEYTNGTLGLIDCKVTTGAMDDSKVNHYLPQLEAYCYALENPLHGMPYTVAHSGLMMWKIDGVWESPEDETSVFGVEQAFLMVPRDPDGFLKFMTEVIAVLDGHIPESGDKCKNCNFVSQRILADSRGNI